MTMIIVFDLDDTLYDERTYVESGLLAVASFGFENFGWDIELSFRHMTSTLNREGRGIIFDKWLIGNGNYNKTLVKKCIQVYRHHEPKLRLHKEAAELLPSLIGFPLYLVTDGHKIVQQKKIQALDLSPFFSRIFITHRYGIHNAKPSTYCFTKIKERENCQWHQMLYVGDNPSKDFVNLKPLGVHTIRVLTGNYKMTQCSSEYDASYKINDLSQFNSLLMNL